MSDARSSSSSDRPPETAVDLAATEPSQALAEVWDLLDALPDVAASPAMMATTMEMAAAPAAGATSRGRATSGRWETWGWLPAIALVLLSLGIGIAAGRSTLPNPETGILTYLPLVQHLELLREAGSVAFLEELAKRDYPAPRRLPPTRSPADVLADVEEFDAALASFRRVDGDGAGKEMLATRREQVLGMPERERRQLDKSVEAFLRLSASDRRELIAVGRALADPSRQRLVDAARLWHQWIQLRDPADRRDVIDLGTADRLEWLDRMTRLDARMEGRDGMRQFFERDPRRRPQGQGGPEFAPPGPPRQGPPGSSGMQQRPRGPGGPGGPAGQGGPGPRGPEPRGPEGEGRGRPPVRPAEPPPPPETPAPPR